MSRALVRLKALVRGLLLLSELDRDGREALRRLATTVGTEHIAARRSPTIDPTAIISPLASLRFTDRVEIGPRATVGPYCCVWGGWSDTVVRIGAKVLLSPGVVVVAGNHRTAGPGPIRDLGFDEADASVGDGAWIGAHAVIIGCSVGEGAVVAAGAVVTEDIPARAIAAGAPARVVGYRED